MADNQLQTQLAALTEAIQRLNTRMDIIEEHTRPRNPDRELVPRHRNERSPERNDDKLMKQVKIEAPIFDGCLDPWVFTKWLKDMDRFFEWYQFSEERKYRFAKMKLTGSAQLYWESVENLLARRREPPVVDWEEMKVRLKRKYLPLSYHGNLLDQWNDIRQGNRPVKDYVTQFDELMMRCNVQEDEAVTLSRFRRGLSEELRREVILRGVTTLDEAYTLVQNYELVAKPQFGKRNDNRPPNNRPSSSNTTSILGPPPSTQAVKDNRNKSNLSEGPRNNSRVQCFKCHGFGHVSASCPTRALIIGEDERVEGDESVEEQVYEPNMEEFEDVDEECEENLVGCLRTISHSVGERRLASSNPRMGVVRCTLTQTRETEDWRRHAIFHTYTKINDKGCKVIVDSGSCINAVSSSIVVRLGLQTVPHPHPYNVSWVDASSITVKERCLVPIQFLDYKDKIWCDVISMDVGHIILGRPWLFDLDVTLYGRSNSCSFMFNGKKIHLKPIPPKQANPNKGKEVMNRKGLNFISPKELIRDMGGQKYIVFALVVKEVSVDSPNGTSRAATLFLTAATLFLLLLILRLLLLLFLGFSILFYNPTSQIPQTQIQL